MDLAGRKELLDRVLASPEFGAADRMRQLLAYLALHEESPKETVIGVEVFGREADYDPKIDGVVRSEVRRLRSKLQEYYAGSGMGERWRFEIPKGSYWVAVVENPMAASTPPVQRRRWWIPLTIGALGVVVLVGTGAWRQNPATGTYPAEPILLTHSLGRAISPTLSADGELLAYAYTGDEQGIFLRRMSEEQPQKLAGSGVLDAMPALDAEGKWIAFLRNEGQGNFAVMVQEVGGSLARKWATTPRRERLVWLPGRMEIVMSDRLDPNGAVGLVRVNERGEKKVLTQPATQRTEDGQAAISPDGKLLGFTRSVDAGVEEICVVGLDENFDAVGEVRKLTHERRHITRFAFLPDGRGIIASLPQGRSIRTLFRFDLEHPDRLTRIPSAQPLATDPAVAAQSGRLVYSVGVDDLNLYRVNPATQEAEAISPSATLDSSPAISPDGQQLALRSARSGTSEIWVMGMDGSNPRKLTQAQGPVTGSPRWSPGGELLALDSRLSGNADIYVVSAKGGDMRKLVGTAANEVVPNWTRDGQSVYFASDAGGNWQIYRAPLAGGAAPQQVTRNGGFLAQESYDGRWLYFSKRGPGAGLWRQPLQGGAEEKVLDLREEFWGGWALSEKGIYWLEQRPKAQATIRFRSFAGGSDVLVYTIPKVPVVWDGVLAARRDGSLVIYSQVDRITSDLYRMDPR